jgi:hypothetical protein
MADEAQKPKTSRKNSLPRVIQDHSSLIIFGLWSAVTGIVLFRIHRQPYPRSMKGGQYEAVVKGTSLAAVLAAFASGSFRCSSQDHQ